ncbi:MAG: PKD domain-containing protein [Candidatus Bipolaricaulota bacterium]|nr:PKD domain-containing protein [Candidatus Bipolaricaulota bacterium]
MNARIIAAIVGSVLLLSVTGCALFQKAPTAMIDYSQTSPAGFAFDFCGFDPDGVIVSVAWEFDDGEIAEGNAVTHQFQRTGDYCVCATVTDDAGLHDEASLTVHASREIHVLPDASIQAAIDAAEPGDTVMIEPGLYYERIDFKGKAITVRSANLEMPAILNQRAPWESDSTGAVVTFKAGEGRDSILQGVHLKGIGRATDYSGAAILLAESSPTILDCTMERFAATQGGAVAAYNSNALITYCEIKDCAARLNGGGIYAQGHSAFPEFVGNQIENNRAEAGGGIYFCAEKDCTVDTSARFPILRDNLFVMNSASGHPRTVDDKIGGGVHVGAGLRIVNEGNQWRDNSPYAICYDEAQ